MVPMWIFVCSILLSGSTCCDVHITMATDALKHSSFHVDIHPTPHWSSSLSRSAAHKKQESPSHLPIKADLVIYNNLVIESNYWNDPSDSNADNKDYSNQQKLKVSGLQYAANQASPMASTRAFQLLAKVIILG